MMNKNELISELNNKIGLSKKDCKLCLDAVVEIIKTALQNGDSVTLLKFGKFKINEVKSKCLYNFKTKNTQLIEAKKVPSFKASDNLKECFK